MKDLKIVPDPRVLVGHVGSDDAGVVRLGDDLALVLTVDFFTPVVDDPYDFGRVAAVNALSDVWAMGGRPFAALNVAGFPEKKLPAEVIAEILRGGADVAAEAGVALVGGHTVDDDEVKYGMAVVGTVHPDRVVTNAGAQPGDRLVLTKPLGTGVLSTQLKRGELDEAGTARLVEVLTRTNRAASERMLEAGVHACTDVTGYGLLGHAAHIARESGVTVAIDAAAVPLMDGALEAARAGHVPGGLRRNRAWVDDLLRVEGEVDDAVMDVLCDPQTAGGLLVALPADAAEGYARGLEGAAVVGECLGSDAPAIVVR